ncbi:MAG: enoyl-CoA hydratase-related protein [Chloroflexi bacterium]|nr:enoyl-CoA hydratase-related protein [Chloroflexota bacterium]MDA1240650.1 enoyl-CoA hydratase-related protein [Chloroflexota bacterium]
MTDYEFIRTEQVGRVRRIILNRPNQRNPLSRRVTEEVDAAFIEAGEDNDVGVIVLMGAGDHFSGGHDLGTAEEKADRVARPSEEGMRGRYRRSWDMNVEVNLRWRNIPKPTIAAVHGYCIFAGWAFASSCDVIFAADNAMFLPANFQYFSVPWDMHHRKAKEILFESRFVGAEEAHDLGFVNRVYPLADLDAEVMEYATRVSENDPFQLRMIKLAINQAQDMQGFVPHIHASYAHHLLSSVGESDPDFALDKPMDSGQRRRPMVQRAMENFQRAKERRGEQAE